MQIQGGKLAKMVKRRWRGRLSALLAAGILLAGVPCAFGAYQYIISVDPELSANPSYSNVSSVVSVDLRNSSSCVLSTALETRYCAFAESNTSGLNRLKPSLTLVIR